MLTVINNVTTTTICGVITYTYLIMHYITSIGEGPIYYYTFLVMGMNDPDSYINSNGIQKCHFIGNKVTMSVVLPTIIIERNLSVKG